MLTEVPELQIQELEMDKSEEVTQEVSIKFADAAAWWADSDWYWGIVILNQCQSQSTKSQQGLLPLTVSSPALHSRLHTELLKPYLLLTCAFS